MPSAKFLNSKLSTIGDSVSADANGWQVRLLGMQITGHAAGGATIMAQLDGQVAAAAGDTPNFIIVEMGTNDNNAGDMVALQAKVETNLATLKTDHPTASIYYMNVLPRWTDATGATPVDKSNIRAAIAAACAAQGITCWDTFTTPWITAAQTTDGLHPSSDGYEIVATQVLARLP